MRNISVTNYVIVIHQLMKGQYRNTFIAPGAIEVKHGRFDFGIGKGAY